jgi:hypothetical protein
MQVVGIMRIMGYIFCIILILRILPIFHNNTPNTSIILEITFSNGLKVII